MVDFNSKKTGDLLLLANSLLFLVLLNILSSIYFFRLDLTEEKRYTIHESTRQMLVGLDDDVYVEVYLEGELNAGFRRFQKAIRETRKCSGFIPITRCTIHSSIHRRP